MDAKELGRQVLTRRKELGLTQGELAEQAGISRNYVSLIERGEARNVSVNVLNELAATLGTTPAELSGQSGWADTLIPPALREFALKKDLNFGVVDRLAHLPHFRARQAGDEVVLHGKGITRLSRPYQP